MRLPVPLPSALLACAAFAVALHGAAAHAGVTDANSADQAALQQVAGIGPAIAARIVAARREGGPFRDLDDLRDRVRGVGESNVRKMAAAGLAVGAGGASPSAQGAASGPAGGGAAQAQACAVAGVELIVGNPRPTAPVRR